MTGKRNDNTGVWYLPVNPTGPPVVTYIDAVEMEDASTSVEHSASNSLYTLPYKQQQLK